MVEDQASGLRKDGSSVSSVRIPRRLRCIAVSSGKGGVGKTAISIGLGYSLVRMGYKALILDADVGLANVDLQMGLEPKCTIQDVVHGDASLEEVVMTREGGPDVLPSSSGSTDMVDTGNARQRMFVEDLIKFAAGYDYLIIDVAAGIGRSVTAFLEGSPEVLVVVVNEPTSIMDAYSLIKILLKSGSPPAVTMVINMVRSINEGELLSQRLNRIVMKFLGVEIPVGGIILFDEKIRDSIRRRVPLLEYAGDAVSAACIRELASYVTSGKSNGGAGKKANEEFFESVAGMAGRE